MFQRRYDAKKPQEFERITLDFLRTLHRFKVWNWTLDRPEQLSGFAWKHGYRKQGINRVRDSKE